MYKYLSEQVEKDDPQQLQKCYWQKRKNEKAKGKVKGKGGAAKAKDAEVEEEVEEAAPNANLYKQE